MLFTFELISLIFFYIKNNIEPVKTYGKIYYKNFNICNYIKQKDLYNLSKINKSFYLVYKSQINKCILCNKPYVTITIKCCNHNSCNNTCNNSSCKVI